MQAMKAHGLVPVQPLSFFPWQCIGVTGSFTPWQLYPGEKAPGTNSKIFKTKQAKVKFNNLHSHQVTTKSVKRYFHF
jgi:hypothetical protein